MEVVQNNGLKHLEEQIMIMVIQFNKPLMEDISLQDIHPLLEMEVQMSIS
jgi:hypothetical protein